MAVVAGRQRRPLPLGTAVSSRGGVPPACGLAPSEAGAARLSSATAYFCFGKNLFCFGKKVPQTPAVAEDRRIEKKGRRYFTARAPVRACLPFLYKGRHAWRSAGGRHECVTHCGGAAYSCLQGKGIYSISIRKRGEQVSISVYRGERKCIVAPAQNTRGHGVAAVFPAARLSSRPSPAGSGFASPSAAAPCVPSACGLRPCGAASLAARAPKIPRCVCAGAQTHSFPVVCFFAGANKRIFLFFYLAAPRGWLNFFPCSCLVAFLST